MPDITCPVCNKDYLIEAPDDWRDFVEPTGDRCNCKHETKLYIATDSSVDYGYFKCPESVSGNDCEAGCTICDGEEMVSHDRIIEMLMPRWMKDYEVTNWNFYTPTTLDAYFSNSTEVWYEGCECFGTYDETGCWNCLLDEQNVEPEAVHVTLMEPESTTTLGRIFKRNSKDRNAVFLDLTEYLDPDGDLSRSDGALWITDDIGAASALPTQPMLYSIIINRTNIR